MRRFCRSPSTWRSRIRRSTFMRGPGPDMRINKITDPVTQVLIAYTLEGIFGRDDRVIWMDGRPHPSEYVEHTWDGFSTGKVEGNKLTVTTTHMKYGVIQRNGVPASAHATMTEHFIRHGDFLTLVTIVDDPVYLEEPFIRTSHWVRTSNITLDQRFIFEVVDEVAGHKQGYVPHYPLGTRHDEFAKKHGLPFEATQGGKETIYPEYESDPAEGLGRDGREAGVELITGHGDSETGSGTNMAGQLALPRYGCCCALPR